MKEIIIYGRDPRMEYVAGYFYHMGFEVSEALDTAGPDTCVITAPKLNGEEEQRLADHPASGYVLWHGVLSEACRKALGDKQISAKPYLSLKKLVTENADLTARAILKIASLGDRSGKHADACVGHQASLGDRSLVLGYGYCGKAIADALANTHTKVDVCVRRKEQKIEIREKGFGYLNFSQLSDSALEGYSDVFNTVPALVLTADVLQRFSDGVRIYDIATAPGGTDFSYCRAHGIRAELYPGLPGKLYPKEAGTVIASCIYEEQFAADPPAQ